MSTNFEGICFNLGDILVSETVIHDDSSRAISAEAIKGAFEVLKKLTKAKYKIAFITNDKRY
jgi:histidinol phosphatase-like enzyme